MDTIGLVLDIGQLNIKFGYAGDEYPKITRHNIIGINLDQIDSNTLNDPEGSQPMATPSKILEAKLTSDNIAPENFIYASDLNKEQSRVYVDSLIKEDYILQQRFTNFYKNDLQYNLGLNNFNENGEFSKEMHPILLSEPNKTNKYFRKNMAEMFFEGKQTNSQFLCKKAMLSMYSCGKTNGVVQDSGANTTTLSPVEEGYVLQPGVVSSQWGGEDITRQITLYLLQKEIKPKFKFMNDSNKMDLEMDNNSPFDSTFENYHIEEYARDFKHQNFKLYNR